MSDVTFPDLKGLTWDIEFTDSFETIAYSAPDPTYETRISKQVDPRIAFKLSYSVLRDQFDNSLQDELNIIRGFWRARQGDYDSFLLDPSKLTRKSADASISNQLLTVDGNNYAPLIRTMGTSGYNETIYTVNQISNVFANSVAVTFHSHNSPPIANTWSYWDANPKMTYGGTSYPGVVIQFANVASPPVTVNFSWYYRVRFDKGEAKYNEMMFQLYELQEIDLILVRA